MIELKQQLHSFCRDYLTEKRDNLQAIMRDIQASANEESKSSVGDKYETGRAMMQLEIEKNSIQLRELNKQLEMLEKVPTMRQSVSVESGSVVETNQGNFYIAISAGPLRVNNIVYMAISPLTPIAQCLMGKTVHHTFLFNQKTYTISKIF